MSDYTPFTFKLSWFEPMAGISREYVLSYFVAPSKGSRPNELSIYDVKFKKVFLKRVPYPSVTLSDLYKGSIVTIFSRQYEIAEYGDSKTRQTFEASRGRIVVALPPAAYPVFGLVLQEASNEQLSIANLKTLSAGASSDGSEAIQMLVEFVGDDIEQAWERAENRVPGLAGLLQEPGGGVMAPNEKTASAFKSPDSTATFDHCALCIIKPHAVKAGFTGTIIETLIQNNFQLTAAQVFHLTRVEAENFLEVYKGVVGNSEYSELTMDLASGPLVAVEVQGGPGCVSRLRELCGPHDVEIARALRPNTLRSRYGVNNVQNAVHCTDLEEDGALESQFFFDIVTRARAV